MKAKPRWIPSLDLVHRVSETSLSYTLSRMKVLERIPGNPVGVAYRTFGHATALAARNLPSTSFNTVMGLRAGEAHQVRPLIEWSRAHGSSGRFEIVAGDYEPALGRELVRRNYYPSGYHAALVGEPDADVPSATGHSIEQVATSAQMEDFLDAYVAGWSLPEAARDSFRANVRAWFLEPDWRLYLARIDGRPAAAAVLFLRDRVGYFADCATAPSFRRLGLHAALLRSRWQEAKAAGVEFVCAGADYLSTSHRNMERAGMRLLFLRAIWTPLK